MKKELYLLRNCLALIALCLSISACAQKTLTILHTNDVHSRIEPLEINSADSMTAGRGGFLRVATYVEEMRKEGTNLLMLDSGDFSQGTPFYNMFKGEVEIKLMNAIGYDAGTIGNHEFDFGLENMARLFRMANFPIVCANYDVKGTVLEGLVKPYVILEKYGLKIGVFGLGTRLEGLVQKDKYEDVVYRDPYEAANNVAQHLKKEGCNVVVCLSHLGYRSSTKDATCDIELAQKTHNIDIILGGHSHTLLEEPVVLKNTDGKDVYITQMGKSGIFVGRVDLTF